MLAKALKYFFYPSNLLLFTKHEKFEIFSTFWEKLKIPGRQNPYFLKKINMLLGSST